MLIRNLVVSVVILGILAVLGRASSDFESMNNIQEDSAESIEPNPLLSSSSSSSLSSSLRGLAEQPRDLQSGPLECINGGGPFKVGQLLNPGQAICSNNGKGDWAQFGIKVTPDAPEPGYTMYTVTFWVNGVEREISGIGMPTGSSEDPPFMTLQHDGHLLFGPNSGWSGCTVFPGSHSNKNLLNLRVSDTGEADLYITDKDNKVVWRLSDPGCYPDVPNRCYSEIRSNTRISWKEFLCLNDKDGNVKFRYGLDETGSFGLWRYDQLVYRPKGILFQGWVRGDYFHFQNDGHLTVYRENSAKKVKTFIWTSDGCIDKTADVLKFTKKGDVQELNKNGDLIWVLKGSKAPATVSDARDTVPEVCYAD